MKHRLLNTLIALAVAVVTVLVSACATHPVTGRQQLMLVSESQAISASRQAYVQMLEPIAKDGRVNNDPEVVARINAITGRVVAQAIKYRPETREWDWEMTVIDNPDVANAFAMAGGKMAIYTGMINKLEATDDELAQVIAHEVAHSLSAHTAEKMSVSLATNLAITGYALTGERSAVALGGAALAAALAVQLPHSRQMEREADRIGIELAARAGYDPQAAVSLWQKMDAMGNASPPPFLSTHPTTESRIRDLRDLARQMQPLYEEARAGTPPTHPL
ncbi:peptidase M48 Ste24p [Thioalkalivibrio denitrificans]|uniref:Peptidase M48 Ste24p n=1 Tax=Thioalkalivibrio denitrificans TaxID=108003 RepID=A0A1V3NLJ9_9GAMM|nr:M48 family metallopeptidase [Thioalkalivibrio denitrificans]OOG25989.1 peptidase M48 Ste24p [Thioalkalivibrio denitrificans]